MSGVKYFDDGFAINPYMDDSVPIDLLAAQAEHESIRQALIEAGVTVTQVEPPQDCQDGVYTANWALCKDAIAVPSRLPLPRRGEEEYARRQLQKAGKQIIEVPEGLRFSGQGDALPCGQYLFAGTTYRTDKAVHDFLADKLGYTVLSLQTKPQRTWYGRSVKNKASGWPDSFYYDIDLALSILRAPSDRQKGLIAWCPAAFTKKSQAILRDFDGVDKIEVSASEARNGFACNLVSTGETVIMSANAPLLKSELEKRGFTTITPTISELAKGGGYIRCTTLTLN